jgi:hypothetical protein
MILDFQNAFKKWQEVWERCIHVEGDYFEGDGGTKLVFDQIAAPVPEIMDGSLYINLTQVYRIYNVTLFYRQVCNGSRSSGANVSLPQVFICGTPTSCSHSAREDTCVW